VGVSKKLDISASNLFILTTAFQMIIRYLLIIYFFLLEKNRTNSTFLLTISFHSQKHKFKASLKKQKTSFLKEQLGVSCILLAYNHLEATSQIKPTN